MTVELVIGPEALWRGPLGTQRLAARYGLAIGSIHGPILPLPGWGDGPTNVPRLVDYASAMEPIPLVVLHVPRARDMDRDAAALRYRAALAEWRERLDERPVPIALETPGLFHPEERQFTLFDLDALASFAESEGIQVVLDTVHVGSLSYDLMEAYRRLRPLLANVHLSDMRHLPRILDIAALHSYIKHHQLPGSGWLPLCRFVRALTQDGYHGLLTLELSPVAVRAWSFRRARGALQACISFVSRNGQEGADI